MAPLMSLFHQMSLLMENIGSPVSTYWKDKWKESSSYKTRSVPYVYIIIYTEASHILDGGLFLVFVSLFADICCFLHFSFMEHHFVWVTASQVNKWYPQII